MVKENLQSSLKSKYNNNIIVQLSELRDLINLENTFYKQDEKFKIANSFRIRSYNYAIKVIKSFEHNIKDLNELNFTGIGKTILAKIKFILENPDKILPQLKDLKLKLKGVISKNKIINELTNIIGIGNKFALKLINEYNIKSIKDLKEKIKNKEIEVDQTILLGLKYHNKYKNNIPRNEVKKITDRIKLNLNKYDKNLLIFICGSYRRQLKYCGDIDVIISHKKFKTQKEIIKTSILEKCVEILKKKKLIIDDLTYKSYKSKYMGFCKYKSNPVRRIDIRLFGYECLPTALTYYTGPYDFNTRMRQIAKRLGYKLNEYGLFKLKDNQKIKINSEKDLFKKLKLIWLEPYNR